MSRLQARPAVQVSAVVVVLALILGATSLLRPSATQAAAPSEWRQAASPLATPKSETATAGHSAISGSQGSEVTVATTSSSMVRSSRPATVTITGAPDNAALRTFMSYLLSGYGTQASAITVTVGSAPADWPLALPLPDGAEIAGGFVRRGEYEENLLFVQGEDLADAALADDAGLADVAASMLDTIRTTLMAQGYTAPPSEVYGGSSVFLPSVATVPDLLCDPDGAYIVSLGPVAVADQPAAVRISLSPKQSSDICRGDGGRGTGAPLLAMLPQLTPPPGADVMPQGTGMGGDQVDVDARIVTELSAAEVAEHYEAQLAAAGWENLGQAADDPIAWSSWRFENQEGEPWTATFTVVQQGDDETRFEAALRVERQR